MNRRGMTRRAIVRTGLATGFYWAVPRGVFADTPGVPTPPVDTTGGRVRGLQAGGVSRFLGIPYGEDTSTHRFQPPRPAGSWIGVRDCFRLGAKAPQGPITIPGIMGRMDPAAPGLAVLMAVARCTNASVPESEDCLFLNVITPHASRGGRRPVMVWLHGGAFSMGSGLDPMTDGGRLAERGDLVIVSLNHRLNALGYLYLGALDPDFADSGNAGQLDIVLALQWVRDNIAAFGGDPGNVTIFGESGGGLKVGALLGTVPAQGLFHKAIAQSGPVVRLVSKEDAAEIAERTMAALAIPKADVRQLQTLEYRKVIGAASAIRLPSAPPRLAEHTLAPVVDGRCVPADPFDPMATPLSRDVPLMIGSCKDECTLFLAGDPDFGTMTMEQARERFDTFAGDGAAGALQAYRTARPDDQPSYWVSSLMTDRMFRTNTIVQADRKAAQQAAPVFVYRVDYEPRVVNRLLRTPHGTDVPLMFGNLVPPEFIGSGEEVAALSNIMMQAWINFARSGNPARTGLAWPHYDSTRRQTMIFDISNHVVSDPDPITRKLWTS
jgi:para-nitrobenzyl esterase